MGGASCRIEAGLTANLPHHKTGITTWEHFPHWLGVCDSLSTLEDNCNYRTFSFIPRHDFKMDEILQ